MKKLAMFDMDGTLFDTSEVNFLSYREAAMKLGYEISREAFMKEYEGKNYKDFLPLFGISDKEQMEEIHRLKKECYAGNLKHARVNQMLVDYLLALPEEYVKAIVTTASKKNTMDILKEFQLEEAFDIFITQEDITRLKPNPECYLLAMEQAGVMPEHAVIFEDSEVGMRAAMATGASIMQVRRF